MPTEADRAKSGVHVDYLKRHPEHLHTVAQWIHDEWDHVTEDLNAVVEKTRARIYDDRVPLTLVALLEGACVGTIGLWETDLASRTDLFPWLAALYVHPSHRGTGVGGALMDRLIDVARGLGIRRLYLHTETASGYYRRKGWRFLFATINDRAEATEVFDLAL